jgi:cobalt-zinc-cadmium efflux system outer membrane protein
LALLAEEKQLQLAEAAVRLQERVRRFFREKRELGDANRLDLNLVEIEYGQSLRDREAIQNERDRLRLELNRLLGLPPADVLPLQVEGDPLAFQGFVLDLTSLESILVDHRPELRAAKQRYEQAEQSLHLAYIQRWPWPRFGPDYEQDGSAGEGVVKKLGIGFGMNLPLFNRGQGEIPTLEATRDKLREEFVAQTHLGRAEVNEAYRNLRAQERLIRVFKETIEPALRENEELTEAGFKMGEFNLVHLITTQDKALKGRRDFLQAELDYWKAALDLEKALGVRLPDIGAGDKVKP